MTKEEKELLIEVAMTVFAIAPPDHQRLISRALQRCHDADLEAEAAFNKVSTLGLEEPKDMKEGEG